MRILGRDLKKIIREEIGREMHHHAKSETLSKHSGFSEEDDIVNEDDGEYEDKLVGRTPGEIAAEIAAKQAKQDALMAKFPSYRALMAGLEDARRAIAYTGEESDGTASTQPVMDFGTTEFSPDGTKEFSPDEIRGAGDTLREGKNITERLMERWLR